MSDFAGIWRLDGRPVDNAELAKLDQSLDGKGIGQARIWRSESMGLVHRQHFFTKEDQIEQQPTIGISGLVLAADVRLCDRPALLHALELPKDWINQADSVLLLHALERWGVEAALKRLCGEFSFCLWNPKTQTLSLARDPSGMRTLYIYRDDKLIAFSTRVRALLALPEISRDLDELAIADFLAFNPNRPARTLYRTIDRISMGHLAVLTPDNFQQHRYWLLPEPGTLKRANDAEYEEQAREVLDRAVADAMRANGPICSFLTGGLDSANVTLSAARQISPKKLTVLTRAPSGAVPPDTAFAFYDESTRAQALAKLHPNIDWYRIEEDGEDWGEHDFSRYFMESGLPHRMHVNASWFFPLYRAVLAQGSNVCLTGDMGNAFFSYTGHTLLSELFLKLLWKSLFEHLQALSKIENVSLLRASRRVLGPFEPFWLRRQRLGYKELHWSRHCALSFNFAQELRFDETLDWSKYRMRLGGGHPSTQELRRWMCDDEVSRDSIGVTRAMTGLDQRIPLIDKRVVEFFGSLPLDQFLKDGISRSLPRRLLMGKAPDEYIHGRTMGFQVGDWFSKVSALRPKLLTDMARIKASPLASRVVDLEQLQNLLDNWPENIEAAERQRRNYFTKLTRSMEVACFLAWHEEQNR